MLLTDALRYPFRSDHPTDAAVPSLLLVLVLLVAGRIAAALVPSLLLLVPLAVAVAAAVVGLGYLERVVADTAAGEDAPPAFGRIRALLSTGASVGALGVLYLLPPVLVLLVTIRGSNALSNPDLTASIAFRVGSTATLFVAMGFAYALPAAVARFADGAGLRAAADPRGAKPLLTNAAYFTSWVMAGSIALGGWGLLGLAAANSSVGGLLSAVAAVYASVVAARLVGTGYARAVDGGTSP